MFTGEPPQTLEDNKHHQNTVKTEKETKIYNSWQKLSARPLFALNRTIFALATPFLALALRTVDGNVRGENECENNFIRTGPNQIRTEDTFIRTESTRILLHHHACP